MLPTDRVMRCLIGTSLRATFVFASEAARHASIVHDLRSVSAHLLAQGVSGALLLASTLKGSDRVNLQLECDGPLRGLFVDAGADGSVRGYVKNAHLDMSLGEGPFRWRPALGNSGFLSVLRPLPGGEYYRSSVQLSEFDLQGDLLRYLLDSDQVPSGLALVSEVRGTGLVDVAAGILIQALPGGELTLLSTLAKDLGPRLAAELKKGAPLASVPEALFGELGVQLLEHTAVRWQCTCSKERVLAMLGALGEGELKSMVEEQGKAVVKCEFCGTRHEASREDLQALIEATK